jgi:hypothetical protein
MGKYNQSPESEKSNQNSFQPRILHSKKEKPLKMSLK